MERWKETAAKRKMGVRPGGRPGRSMAFMLELLIMMLFFLLAGAITAQVFVRAHTISRQAYEKQQAILLVSDAYEAASAKAEDPALLAALLDARVENGALVSDRGALRLRICLSDGETPAGRMITAEIFVENAKGEVLAWAEALRYVSGTLNAQTQ